MDQKSPWLDGLSSWMENKEGCPAPDEALAGLRGEWQKAAQETDTLLHCSRHIQKAFTHVLEKYDSGL